MHKHGNIQFCVPLYIKFIVLLRLIIRSIVNIVYVINIYKEQIIFCSLYITDSDYRYWKERQLKFWFRNWIIREPYYILNILLFMNLKMINQLMFKLINQPRSKSIKRKFYGRFNVTFFILVRLLFIHRNDYSFFHFSWSWR